MIRISNPLMICYTYNVLQWMNMLNITNMYQDVLYYHWKQTQGFASSLLSFSDKIKISKQYIIKLKPTSSWITCEKQQNVQTAVTVTFIVSYMRFLMTCLFSFSQLLFGLVFLPEEESRLLSVHWEGLCSVTMENVLVHAVLVTLNCLPFSYYYYYCKKLNTTELSVYTGTHYLS